MFSQSVQVRLTPDLQAAVNEYAHVHAISRSSVLRLALSEFFHPPIERIHNPAKPHRRNTHAQSGVIA